jgi:hypothetical protein
VLGSTASTGSTSSRIHPIHNGISGDFNDKIKMNKRKEKKNVNIILATNRAPNNFIKSIKDVTTYRRVRPPSRHNSTVQSLANECATARSSGSAYKGTYSSSL